jgi:fatty-acyl-CoA synthase
MDRHDDLISVPTFGDMVAMGAERWSHDAIVTRRQRVTFPQLDERVDDFARSFAALGIVRNDKIGILMSQDVDYMAALIGATRIGAVAVPINARFKARELGHVIRASDMRILMLTAGDPRYTNFLGLVKEAIPGIDAQSGDTLSIPDAPMLRHVVLHDAPAEKWTMSPEAFFRHGERVSRDDIWLRGRGVSVRDVALILYTSGTTSSPKGALMTHEAFMRCGTAMARDSFRITDADRTWCPMPMFHVGGVAFMVTALVRGATYVHSGDFDPGVSARQLRDERITVAWPAFDMMWQGVIMHPDFDEETGKRIRAVLMSVGLPTRMKELQERLPNALQIAGFGATESAGLLTMGNLDDPQEVRIGSMGRPLTGMEMRLINPETGREVEGDELGEICYRGPSCFSGYYRDPEMTKKVIDAEGFFHSGDLGQYVFGDRLRYVSRLKDMLKVGGENVAAAEIEDHLQTHPAVHTAQVVSAPDARYHEVPAAYIQLKPSASTTEAELIEHCRGVIATFKVPRYVRFVAEFPMSGTKIKKNELRDMIAAELHEKGITEAPKVTSRALN